MDLHVCRRLASAAPLAFAFALLPGNALAAGFPYGTDYARVPTGLTMHKGAKRALPRCIKRSGARCAGKNLRRANLDFVQMPRGIFRKADLRGADLVSASIRSGDLRGARLSPLVTGAHARHPGRTHRTNLTNASLHLADLRRADLTRAHGTSVDLTGVRLDRVRAVGVHFADADFTDASLAGADLRGARLLGAVLKNARLDGADLRTANLRGADLENATFAGTHLYGATLLDTGVSESQLAGAKLCRTTLPSGVSDRDCAATGMNPGKPVEHRMSELPRVVKTGPSASRAVHSRPVAHAAGELGFFLSWCDARDGADCHDIFAPGAALHDGSVQNCNCANAFFGDAQFINMNFEGGNFHLAFLAGANLSGSSFRIADLSNASLDQANVTGVNFEYAILDYADLDNATFGAADFGRGASLTGAGFRNADLSQIKFNGKTGPAAAKLLLDSHRGAKFCNTTLPGGRVNNRDCDSYHVTSGCHGQPQPNCESLYYPNDVVNGRDLSHGNFAYAFLNGSTFQSDDFSYGDFYLTQLDGAHLQYSNFTGAELLYTDMSGADLTGATLDHINGGLDPATATGLFLDQAVLKGASLKGANLKTAQLVGADLTGADLTGANLSNANLDNANLTNANLTGANLTSAQLDTATLTGAKLTHVNFSHANLSSVGAGGANFSYSGLIGTQMVGLYAQNANFTGVAMFGANVSYADFSNANMGFLLQRTSGLGSDWSGAATYFPTVLDISGYTCQTRIQAPPFGQTEVQTDPGINNNDCTLTTTLAVDVIETAASVFICGGCGVVDVLQGTAVSASEISAADLAFAVAKKVISFGVSHASSVIEPWALGVVRGAFGIDDSNVPY